jgi:hypothetical protein
VFNAPIRANSPFARSGYCCIGAWHRMHLSSITARAAGVVSPSNFTLAFQYGSFPAWAIIDPDHNGNCPTTDPAGPGIFVWHWEQVSAGSNNFCCPQAIPTATKTKTDRIYTSMQLHPSP